ncbi:MAG: hypothetical protein A3C54_06775 [Deltaproteobacteria bacterium RIFCSPHIGHO2_02_FULL_60_17]|nr:MAG: hypothetical protein A3C54_06775 [Deltaproteobacteria bacterium RIFCSPHIGHO2_02_FULL_60_17]
MQPPLSIADQSRLRGRLMIDLSSEGIRCRAAQEIRKNRAIVRPCTEGTIQYEIENTGRDLIHVQWDNGLSLNVSPSEIEIVDGAVFWH